jgi:hypothetical protein
VIKSGKVDDVLAQLADAKARFPEPFPISSVLVFGGLKDTDGGDDRGGSAWAATELRQDLPGLQGDDGAFAGCPVAGMVGVDFLLIGR